MQDSEVITDGGDGLGHRPDPIEAEGNDCLSAQRCQDLNGLVHPVARASCALSGVSRTLCQLFSINEGLPERSKR